METVNWIEHNKVDGNYGGDFVAWLVLNAIMSQKEKFKQLQDKGMKSDELQIEFKINGIEFLFVETCRILESHLDEMIIREAKELIKKKFAKLDDTLYNFQEMLQDTLKEAEMKVRKEFNLPFDGDN